MQRTLNIWALAASQPSNEKDHEQATEPVRNRGHPLDGRFRHGGGKRWINFGAERPRGQFGSVDNLVDVVDYDKSINLTDVTTRFYLSDEKIKELSDSKRHVFKPVGMTKTFFSIELFEALVRLDEEGKINTSIVAFSFDTTEETPQV